MEHHERIRNLKLASDLRLAPWLIKRVSVSLLLVDSRKADRVANRENVR